MCSPEVRRHLDRLLGQWVEAVDVVGPALSAPSAVAVTSRGWTLHGDLRIDARSPAPGDIRLLGAVIARCDVSPGGDLSLHLTDPDGHRPVELTAGVPWSWSGPRGLRLTAAQDGAIDLREETGRQIATEQAMSVWRAAAPSAQELSLLEAAEDDWLSPADVVDAAVAAGVRGGDAIADHGITVLARLLARGDIIAGSLGADGFQPDGAEPVDVIEHVATLWRAIAPRLPGAGQIAWFDLTDAGTHRRLRADRRSTGSSPRMRMHRDQLEITAETAARLITTLLPQVSPADIHVQQTSAATQHIVRIGTDLVARFPLVRTDPDTAREQLLAEHRAMTEFAEHCPVPTPRPVAIGAPSAEFPMPWSVQTWLPGDVATPHGLAESDAFVEDLAELISALRSIDTRGRTFTGSGRGGDLRDHDAWVAQCLDRSEDLLPVAELRVLWSRWRELERTGPDVMSHTDLIPGNLLSDGTRLTGVLDAGGFAPADPALDLVAAWHLLEAPGREQLRGRLGCSAREWERGAAWAFEQAIGLVWYYQDTNPTLAALGRSTLQRLVSEENRGR